MTGSAPDAEKSAGRGRYVTSQQRSALLVAHTGRADIVELARSAVTRLHAAGFEVRALAGEAADIALPEVLVVPESESAAAGAEIVLVLGGDGTFLRAVELARPTGAPLLGVNLGRVGFLAETEPEAIDETIEQVIERRYDTERRLTLDITVRTPEGETTTAWALNEASVEKDHRERMIEIALRVDAHPLTSFGCDGVLFATPTGSTAYAFSAGGPVVWPSVEAMIVVPNNAHALFARPLVTSVDSELTMVLASDSHSATLCCDSRRWVPIPPGSQIDVRKGSAPVRIVRVHRRAFTDRLVAKFALPVQGFRLRRNRVDGTDGTGT